MASVHSTPPRYCSALAKLSTLSPGLPCWLRPGPLTRITPSAVPARPSSCQAHQRVSPSRLGWRDARIDVARDQRAHAAVDLVRVRVRIEAQTRARVRVRARARARARRKGRALCRRRARRPAAARPRVTGGAAARRACATAARSCPP
eukprot:scaffold51671_cov66-Phaeocystis_antarctica.AAC.2